MICIESVFPDLTRKFVNKGAEFITYIVNDGWYLNSSIRISMQKMYI